MFENLSQREKTLAALVGSMVPLALLVMGLVWFFGQQKARTTRINGLHSQIDSEQQRLNEALSANQRRIYYRSVSMPSNFDDASDDYQQWLKKLVRDEIGMERVVISPRPAVKTTHNRSVIGQTMKITITAVTDYAQVVDFLTEFHQLDLLHRINSLTLVPKSAGASRTGASVRTGEIGLTAEIEILSLIDADADAEGKFLEQFRKLDLPAEAYRDAILKRNIFGPANNSPTLTVSTASSYTADKEIRIPINAKDADKIQELTFSILDSQIDSAKLEKKKKPTDRRVYLTAPKQPAGEYTFKVQVSDSGYPPKSNETEFKITVKEKVVKKPPAKKPPKSEFKNSRETRITAIVKEKSGKWRAWINVRNKGEKHKLAEGESFTLDKQKWQVKSIKPDEVTFTVEGKDKTLRRNQTFDGSEKTASLKR